MRAKLILFGIILLAIFFRFYRLAEFQFWSIDNEIFVALVRKISMEYKIILVTPNASLGISLGSFFHLISAPIFIFARHNPVTIMAFGSIFGVFTTLMAYFTGKELINKRVGLITAFLYAGSFLISLADRRWWPLSPDSFLALVAIYSLLRIIKGHLIYSLPLVIAGSFAWHSDPSLAVILVFIIVSIFLYRIPILKKEHLLALFALLISFLPLVFFEIRHPGAISYPLYKAVNWPLDQGVGNNIYLDNTALNNLIPNFTRPFLIGPSKAIEEQLVCSDECPPPFLSPVSNLVVLSLIILPWILVKTKDKKSVQVVYLYLAAFLFGILTYSVVFHPLIFQHYFLIVYPAVFLLSAVSLDFFWSRNLKILTVTFLLVFLFTNLQALVDSEMRYPLSAKEKVAEVVIREISDKSFSLTGTEQGMYLGGFGGLLFLRGKFPQNQQYYGAWDWFYRAYSLYPVAVTRDKLYPEVVISPDKGIPEGTGSSLLIQNIRVTINQ